MREPARRVPRCGLPVLRRVREARDRGRLGRQRHEIVARQLVHGRVAVGAYDRRQLPAHRLEEAVDVPGLDVDVVALLVLRVLGGDPDDALADVALEAGDTAAGDDRGGAHRDAVGAECDRLGGVDAVLDAAHQHDRHARRLDLLESVESLHDRRQGRDADVLEHLVAGGARSSPGRRRGRRSRTRPCRRS